MGANNGPLLCAMKDEIQQVLLIYALNTKSFVQTKFKTCWNRVLYLLENWNRIIFCRKNVPPMSKFLPVGSCEVNDVTDG